MKRVLVTGADGFVGSVLCPLLEREGFDWVGVDIGYFRACGWKPRSWARVRREDIANLTEKDLEGIDAVCHLAAISNDPMGEISEDLTRRVNFDGTLHVARIARRAGVGCFLFSGSCSVYGKQGDAALTEADPVDPRTAYARSKVDAERELRDLATPDFSVILLRNATAYGESPNLRLDLVVNNLAAHAHTEGRILIRSDGTPWRPVIHVEDMARAFVAFLKSDARRHSGQIYNVGSMAQNYRVSEIATQVQERYPACGVEYSSEADKDSRSYRVDFSKLARDLPEYACCRQVGETTGALREVFDDVRLAPESFASGRFIRLKALQAELKGKG